MTVISIATVCTSYHRFDILQQIVQALVQAANEEYSFSKIAKFFAIPKIE